MKVRNLFRPWLKGSLTTTAVSTLAAVVMAVGACPVAAAEYSPVADSYSLAATARLMNASAWWDEGYTGSGVDVALIDTGVVPVEGLSTPDKIIYGPDLSLESQASNLRNFDTNGHGTFMAGLIAGHDSSLTLPYSGAPATAYRGIAPDARIVSIKVAVADGGADVTQVIAAINWVIQHRSDNGLNIRVLNLSYGTNSRQAYGADPLSYAVEQAWKNGIVVVAAAGNTGYQRGNNAPGLANPAYNPFVIGAGAYDTQGTAEWHDDVVAKCSASSTGKGGAKNPDFVAPGVHLQGLRVPNSFIDTTHPEGRLGDRYFRGTGTSEAAAVASGAVALILQKYPNITPDQVKRFITDNGQKVASFDSQAQGAGELNLAKLLAKSPAAYVQKFTAAKGNGTIEGARGTDHLTRDGFVLSGEQDIFGETVNTAQLATAEASGSSWTGGNWNGSSWTGSSWTGSSWTGSSWTGSSWTGSSWTGSSWTGSSWTGSSWTGSSWTGSSWSGSSWSGDTWATGSWN